jgi:hypothetical protein
MLTDFEKAKQMLTESGLLITTTDKQKSEGRLACTCPETRDSYTLSPSTGWVRIYPEKYRSRWISANTYQLNPTKTVERQYSWGVYKGRERVKLYSFEEMAEIVVRVSKKRKNS